MDERYLLGILAGLVMGWFAFGVIYNIRRGEALLRWLQRGLPQVGERTTLRWLGSSVVELVIAHPKGPWRRMETVVVLAPRDVPWMWLWARLHGRRDTLILRGQLQAAPRIDLELADPAAWTGHLALQQAAAHGWETGPGPGPAGEPGAPRSLQLMAPPGMLGRALALAEKAGPFGARLGAAPTRLSLRCDPPVLELHLPFPDRSNIDAAEFFRAMRDLARALTE